MKIFLVVVLLLCCIILISFVLYKNFNSIKTISTIKENRLINRCVLYENIFDNFIKPKSFLLMTNAGKDLCNSVSPIPYVDYGIKKLFS